MPNENQHWIPKFLVKNFIDTDGRVYCLNIQTDTVTKPPPKHAASRAGFNDFQINREVISFEDKLEKIETQAAPVLKKIVTSKSLAWLTEKQKKQVADFMAAQSFRTDTFYKGMKLGSSPQEFGPVFAELWESAFLVTPKVSNQTRSDAGSVLTPPRLWDKARVPGWAALRASKFKTYDSSRVSR
jgi:Protein of unknown function (DUF4238)